MEEAAKADEIVIMKNGKVILKSSPDKIKSMYAQDCLVLFSNETKLLCSLLDRRGIQYRIRGERMEIPLKKTTDALVILEICRGRYEDFEVQRGSMDDAYLKVMERE